MADDNYTVEMRAIDRDFTRTVNKAIDALEHVEKAAPGAARRIEQLDAALNASAQSGKMTPAVYGRITAQINQISKASPEAGLAIAGLRRELEELQKVQARRTNIDSAHKEALTENRARTTAAKQEAAARAAAEKAAAAEAKAAEKARTAAAKQEAARRVAIAKKEAQDTLGLQQSYNATPGFKQDAAGLANEANTTAFTKRNVAANDELKQAILARGAAAQAVERDHTKALQINSRETQRAATRQQKFAESTYASNLAIDQQRDALSNNRYVLYDVASTWGMVSAATLGASVAAIKVAADYELALASVQRTSGASGAEWDALKASLLDLSTEIPEAFSDITAIATLGGQLGIASENIEEFTETVVKFSATTDVTAEAAAEGIGRLSQLTNTAADEYDNLADSIYETGINAVATESAILSTASQIATAGNMAGFANTEIVALASAFASLNIAPERARGSVQRIFGEITEAVGEGSDQLSAFARVSNMSASSFAAAWANDPQKAFSAFIEGLDGAAKAGTDTNAMLKDLGIGAVRDIQALQALANNTEVYNQALSDTARAYGEGSALGSGYDVVVDTLAKRFELLKNTIMTTVATVGELPGVKAAVDLLQNLAEAFRAIVSNPIGGALTSAAVALSAIIGLFAAFKAVTALAQASAIGLMQAERILGTEFAKNEITGNKLVGTLVRLAVGHDRANAASKAHTAALATNSSMMGRVGAGWAGATAGAAGFGKGLANLAKGGVHMAVITGGLWAIGEGIAAVQERFKPLSQKIDETFGDLSGISKALQEDTKTYHETGEAISHISVAVEKTTSKLTPWGKEIQNLTGDQAALGDYARDTTTAIENQTLAIGEATRAALAQEVLDNEDFMNRYREQAEVLDQAGFSLEKYFNLLLTDPSGKGASLYLDELKAKVIDQRDASVEAASKNKDLAGSIGQIQADSYAAWDALDGFSKDTELLGGVVGQAATEVQVFSAINKALGIDAEETGDEIENEADKFKDLIDSATAAISALAGTESAIEDLGAGLAESGMDFSAYTEGGRANLENLQSAVAAISDEAAGDSEAMTSRLIGLMGVLQNSGADLSGEAGFLGEVLADVFNQAYHVDVDPTAANANIASVIENAIIALQTMAALEKSNAQSAVIDWNKMQRGEPGAITTRDAFSTERSRELEKQIEQLTNLKNAVKVGTKEQEALGRGVDKVKKEYDDYNKSLGDNSRKQKASTKAAKEAKKEFRTLADYASEVAGVFSRAYELRFSVKEAKAQLAEARKAIKDSVKFDKEEVEFDFNEVFNSKFAKSSGKDAISSYLIGMKESAEDAAKAVRDTAQAVADAQARIKGLTADRAILQFQTDVAAMYGENLRVDVGRAKLAEIDAEIASANNELADAKTDSNKAIADSSKSLKGDSAAAIRNRATLLGLASEYVDYIEILEESGASQSEVNEEIERSKKAFEDQARELGFAQADVAIYAAQIGKLSPAYDGAVSATERSNRAAEKNAEKAGKSEDAWLGVVDAVGDTALAMLNSGASAAEVAKWLETQKTKLETDAKKFGISEDAVDDYTGAIDDMIHILGRVPKNVSSEVNFKGNYNPARAAFAEYWAKQKFDAEVRAKSVGDSAVKNKLDAAAKNRTAKINVSAVGAAGALGVLNRLAKKTQAYNTYLSAARKYQDALNPYNPSLASSRQKEMNRLFRLYNSYATGGFTGKGGKYEEAGVVHKGEYVVPKEGVDQRLGIPKPEFLASLFKAQQGMVAPSAPVSSGGNTAIQLVELLPNQLRELAAAVSTQVLLDGQTVAKSVSNRNVNSSNRGAA